METEKKFTKASSDAGYNIGVEEDMRRAMYMIWKKKKMECDVV